MTADEYLRPADVAAEFGIKPGTLKSWRSSTRHGKPVGPASFKLGPARVVYSRLEVERWVDEQKRQSMAAAS